VPGTLGISVPRGPMASSLAEAWKRRSLPDPPPQKWSTLSYVFCLQNGAFLIQEPLTAIISRRLRSRGKAEPPKAPGRCTSSRITAD
jgi:hypothetical protein